MDDAFSFIAGIIALGCFTGIVITWIKRRAYASLRPGAELLDRLDAIADRLARVDGSVDAMAVEVERISEAQRFTARVLAERAASSALQEKPRSVGSTTPH
jgi:hypothetical protein